MYKRHLILLVAIISQVVSVVQAQVLEQTKVIDSLYKEDQFYLGVTYNFFGKTPEDFQQNGISNGLFIGIMKDMPLNKRRNVAIALGLGYGTNTYNNNLYLSRDNNQSLDDNIILDGDTYTRNKYTNHYVEIPFEFRWRTSTPEVYKFWRVYPGIKFGYMFNNRFKYRGDLGNVEYQNLKLFEKFQYGLTLSTGYNTWNLHLYYALTPIISEDTKINGENIDLNSIKVGLIFYVL
ncbi:porin family protein [Aestuariibaculum sediminum]|uniref:PorT family protein n=1 Tax=Aestuariibaculum sediminum TaxID=2770637 RepID=A0A8J6Q2C7_9FLAO|nr:porin family protein [Aestuariibaculum sediminum]MBD0833527.1 PorT family protein [Aestuariibaculum sediminum]